MEPARTLEQRQRDVRARLRDDVDCWVATASPAGEAALVPLSFLWHDDEVILTTEERSVTVRNLRATGSVRLALGGTRDVVLVTGTVRFVPADAIPTDLGDRFAAKAGFDPRAVAEGTYTYLLVTPTEIRAWREVNELPDRTLMRHGTWF